MIKERFEKNEKAQIPSAKFSKLFHRVKHHPEVSDVLQLYKIWPLAQHWPLLSSQGAKPHLWDKQSGNLSASRQWTERAPFWQQTLPGKVGLHLQKVSGHEWRLLLPESALRKRKASSGQVQFGRVPVHRGWVSSTWHEAVRIRPNCGVVVGAKEVGNDHSVLGDEVARNANSCDGWEQGYRGWPWRWPFQTASRLTCCLWRLCVVWPVGRPAWVAALRAQEHWGQEVCVCRCILDTAPSTLCTAPRILWSAPTGVKCSRGKRFGLSFGFVVVFGFRENVETCLGPVQKESHGPVQPGCSCLCPSDEKVHRGHVYVNISQALERSRKGFLQVSYKSTLIHCHALTTSPSALCCLSRPWRRNPVIVLSLFLSWDCTDDM